MKKKLISLLMAGALAAGLLAGCGGKDAQGGKEAETPKQEEAAKPAQEEQQEPAQEEQTSGEKETLRLVIKDVSPEDPVYQEWLEKFNAELDAAGIGAQVECKAAPIRKIWRCCLTAVTFLTSFISRGEMKNLH